VARIPGWIAGTSNLSKHLLDPAASRTAVTSGASSKASNKQVAAASGRPQSDQVKLSAARTLTGLSAGGKGNTDEAATPGIAAAAAAPAALTMQPAAATTKTGSRANSAMGLAVDGNNHSSSSSSSSSYQQRSRDKATVLGTVNHDSLLHGTYDEGASCSSFLEALKEWRNAGASYPATSVAQSHSKDNGPHSIPAGEERGCFHEWD
jgi:hypothetical protein